MRILSRGLSIAIGVYFCLTVVLIARSGIGIDFAFAGLRISANDFMKPLVILMLLICARILISLEIKNLLLLTASMVFALLCAEAGLRILAPPLAVNASLTRMVQPSASLGYKLVPDIEGKGRLGEHVSINAHGLRDVARSWHKPPDTFRILGLGDSFTFGIGVDLEATYLKQLESLLNKAHGHARFDVINAGVSGYNLYQATTYLKEHGLNFEPDMVLYFFFLDDVGGIDSPESARAHYERESARGDGHGKLDNVLNSSYLYNFSGNIATIVSGRFRSYKEAPWLRTIAHRKKALYETTWGPIIKGKVDLKPFEEQLDTLKAICIQNGAPLMVVIIPDAMQVGDPAMQKINRIVTGMLLDRDIPVLDVTPLFDREPDPHSLYLFPLDPHTSAKGNRIIARAIYDALRPMLFKAAPGSQNQEKL
jgi:lysophospholipase L1-like esterase